MSGRHTTLLQNVTKAHAQTVLCIKNHNFNQHCYKLWVLKSPMLLTFLTTERMLSHPNW